jgi:hypothetical protein
MKVLPLAAALIAAATTSACATRGEGDVSRTPNPLVNAATTPLRDVGLMRPEIPELLKGIGFPYQQGVLAGGCPAIALEIGRLDAVLGEESYQPGQERSLSSRAGDYVENYAAGELGDVTDIVPYRGWVRRLSGASRAERKAAAAYALGETRRTFLRGYGAALGCPGVVPDPPPPPETDEQRDAREDREKAEARAANRAAEQAEDDRQAAERARRRNR